MAYTTPTDPTTGELITASWWKTDNGDNIVALRTGAIAIASQAAGDFINAASATQLGRVSGQLAFPATQNPSSDVNTLDDYEEGTWTPVIGGSVTTSGQGYTFQNGYYVKVGKGVFVTANTLLSSVGTVNGNAVLKGLPFVSSNVTNGSAVGPIYFASLATNWTSAIGVVDANTCFAVLKGTQAAAAGLATLTSSSDLGNTTQIIWSASYLASTST